MTALVREQWVGLEGAPSTQTFSVHGPLEGRKISLGLVFLHDKIGVIAQNGLYASYAYRLGLGTGRSLSMGLQVGATNYNAQFSSIADNDPSFMVADINRLYPNFGFGTFYSTKRFYAGFSLPQIATTAFDADNPDSDARLIRHYFATAGYVFDLNESLKLKPNLLIKAVEGAPVEFDINANLLIRELIWLGLSWRSFDSFDALFQINLSKQLQLGYSYDFATTTELRRVNAGSHELMLNYRLPRKKNQMVTPRYF